jgi:hypothetical protein
MTPLLHSIYDLAASLLSLTQEAVAEYAALVEEIISERSRKDS